MYEDETIKREGKGCEEDVMESRTMGIKVFL